MSVNIIDYTQIYKVLLGFIFFFLSQEHLVRNKTESVFFLKMTIIVDLLIDI